jgi:hypothetical protein
MAKKPKRIPTRKPVVKPAVAEKVFPDRRISNLSIRQEKGAQTFTVFMQAYNFDTGEIDDDRNTVEQLKVGDIAVEEKRSTVFSQVLNDLLNYVGLWYQEYHLRGQIENTELGSERDALIAEFHDVQQQMGVTPEPPPAVFQETEVWADPEGYIPTT